MPFLVQADVAHAVTQRSTALLNIHALQTPDQELTEETFTLDPAVDCEEFLSLTGQNRYVRLDTGDATALTVRYSAKVTTRHQEIPRSEIEAVPVARMDPQSLPYLFPSRYCQSDQIGRLAWKEFGDLAHPYQKAAAITAWIHENVEYISGSTDSGTSAADTLTQRAGVCRDFAHLGIALCRALSIPARYLTCYAHQLEPPDFHACFEACIGNRWFVFDATRLAPLNGLVRIANGRDAADASIATVFGGMHVEKMTVSCLAEGPFDPLPPDVVESRGIILA